MVEFTDRLSVQEWCDAQSPKSQLAFSTLTAAVTYLIFLKRESEPELDFRISRALLTVFVATNFDENKVRDAAREAGSFAARSVFSNSSVVAAVSSASTTASTLPTRVYIMFFNPAMGPIAERIETLGPTRAIEMQLGGGLLENSQENFEFLAYFVSQKNSKFSFWIDWYDGLLQGRAPDWELWRAVALIDDAIWQNGPEAVAEAIEGVKAELASKRLPLAENLVADPETGLFSVVPRVVANLPLLAASLGQVRDAVEDVLAEASNGLRETSSDIRTLRRAVERYANDPQRIEMDMTMVSASLLGQVAREDLPASAAILALQAVVQQAADGIRATHPEIAANRDLLRRQARRELSNEAVMQIAEAGQLLEAISEGGLSDDMRDDVFALTEEMRVGAPLLGGVVRDGGDEIVRIGGRVARMMVMLRKSPALVHKLEGSTGYKAVSIMETLGGLVSWLLKIFP